MPLCISIIIYTDLKHGKTLNLRLHLNNYVTADRNLNETIVSTKTDQREATFQFYAFFSASI